MLADWWLLVCYLPFGAGEALERVCIAIGRILKITRPLEVSRGLTPDDQPDSKGGKQGRNAYHNRNARHQLSRACIIYGESSSCYSSATRFNVYRIALNINNGFIERDTCDYRGAPLQARRLVYQFSVARKDMYSFICADSYLG